MEGKGQEWQWSQGRGRDREGDLGKSMQELQGSSAAASLRARHVPSLTKHKQDRIKNFKLTAADIEPSWGPAEWALCTGPLPIQNKQIPAPDLDGLSPFQECPQTVSGNWARIPETC